MGDPYGSPERREAGFQWHLLGLRQMPFPGDLWPGVAIGKSSCFMYFLDSSFLKPNYHWRWPEVPQKGSKEATALLLESFRLKDVCKLCR